ncbi:hypothetical protein LOK49_LG09G02718 [Camellia lanceoleosa]|uniref:Uncharacterized protein n=1 Tax=Camellia lanceoleosa TaxID=1840588 RepID=A0ACC0GJ38_9ERIC|nr:hypothetical protein LOK49_LG09G02718 [Camellia lanceoleosa]
MNSSTSISLYPPSLSLTLLLLFILLLMIPTTTVTVTATGDGSERHGSNNLKSNTMEVTPIGRKPPRQTWREPGFNEHEVPSGPNPISNRLSLTK